jgi:hypothetical protein
VRYFWERPPPPPGLTRAEAQGDHAFLMAKGGLYAELAGVGESTRG